MIADLVECSTTMECTVGFGIGVMSATDCCVSNPRGLAYTLLDFDVCHVCIGKANPVKFIKFLVTLTVLGNVGGYSYGIFSCIGQ